MQNKNLFVVGSFEAPDKNAGAYRTLSTCKMISDNFDHIFVCSGYDGEYGKEYPYNKKISYYPYYNYKKQTFVSKFRRILFPKRLIKAIYEKISRENNITHILIYSVIPFDTLFWIKKLAKKNNIKIIFDVVEYQVFSQQTLGSFFGYYLPQMYINRHLKKHSNVIAISKFLENYFINRGANTFYLPIVNDNNTIRFTKERNELFPDKLVLFYAGSPRGKRDLVSRMIEGINLLNDEEKKKVVLIIAGITAEKLILKEGLSLDEFEKSRENVIYLGRIDKKKIEKLYESVDFSCLIKPEKKRFSNAGFPTKISESFAFGVPAICNLSSDLAIYLEDNKNSLILSSDSAEDFSKIIKKALSLSSKELSAMRIEARKTSEKYFDLSSFHLKDSEFFK